MAEWKKVRRGGCPMSYCWGDERRGVARNSNRSALRRRDRSSSSRSSDRSPRRRERLYFRDRRFSDPLHRIEGSTISKKPRTPGGGPGDATDSFSRSAQSPPSTLENISLHYSYYLFLFFSTAPHARRGRRIRDGLRPLPPTTKKNLGLQLRSTLLDPRFLGVPKFS